VKATYGTYEVKGGVQEASDGAILIACPGCGNCYSLRNPPFTFNRETISIGPASIKLLNCGWHGYLTNGDWITSPDSGCGKLLAMAREGRKVAREDLKIGDHVSFLRMSNKAIRLTGTIAKIHDDAPIVDIALDNHPADSIDNAHVDDVTVIDPVAAETASPALEANLEKLGEAHEGNVVEIPKAE
jgi:hypothetical protein